MGDTNFFTESISKNIALYEIRNGYGMSPDEAAAYTRQYLAQSMRSRKSYQVCFLLPLGSDRTTLFFQGQFTARWVWRHWRGATFAHAWLLGLRYRVPLWIPRLRRHVHYVHFGSSLQSVQIDYNWRDLTPMSKVRAHQHARKRSNCTRHAPMSSNAVSWSTCHCSWRKSSPRTASRSCPSSRRMHLPNRTAQRSLCCLEHNWLVFSITAINYSDTHFKYTSFVLFKIWRTIGRRTRAKMMKWRICWRPK